MEYASEARYGTPKDEYEVLGVGHRSRLLACAERAPPFDETKVLPYILPRART